MMIIIASIGPTIILEGRTNISIIWERLFEALFKRSSPKSSTHTLENDLEKTFPNVGSALQNLRLGSMTLANMITKDSRIAMCVAFLGCYDLL